MRRWLILLILLSGCVPGPPPALNPSQIRVVDGDTIHVSGQPYRLLGFDTPETYEPACSQELARGDAATAAMRALVSSGRHLALHALPEQDRYGRGLARLTADGVDAADLMIEAGHARPYRGGRRRSWC